MENKHLHRFRGLQYTKKQLLELAQRIKEFGEDVAGDVERIRGETLDFGFEPLFNKAFSDLINWRSHLIACVSKQHTGTPLQGKPLKSVDVPAVEQQRKRSLKRKPSE